MDTLTLKLRGMSCAACANNIEKAIRSVPGVIDCNVNFGVEQAGVAIGGLALIGLELWWFLLYKSSES